MPSTPGQWIVALVVLCAVAYFGRHIYGLFKGTASCCGGSKDSGKKHSNTKEFVCNGKCSACSEEEAEKRLGITYRKVDKSELPSGQKQ